MTNIYPDSVQRVVDLNKQCEEIGHAIAAPIFAKGFGHIKKEDKAIIIKLARINMHLQSRLLYWYEHSRNFETWFKMFKELNTNEEFLNIDPTGRLKELATEMLTNGDMEGYYKHIVEPMEMNTTMVKISLEATKMMIADLNDL